MSNQLPGLLICFCAMASCAHPSRPAEDTSELATGKLQKTSQTFLAERGSGAPCQGDSDCSLGEICYPENDRCLSSYPNPRMLDISFTLKEECKLVNLYFPYDSTELVEEAQRWLQYDVRCIKSRGAKEVVVEGHADSRGQKGYNQKLSVERGESVARLLSSAGLEVPVKVVGRGEEEPLRRGKSEKDYAYNRRVELKVQ